MEIIRCTRCHNTSDKCTLSSGTFRKIRDALARGALLVYPTDTLYGIAAAARDKAAVEKLVRLKGRRSPISIAVHSLAAAKEFAVVDRATEKMLQRFLPGALTVLLPASPLARKKLHGALVSDQGLVGIRVPRHPLALRLAKAVPVTATSANRSGVPAAKSVAGAVAQLGDGIEFYIACSVMPAGAPSTVVRIGMTGLKVLREGIIPREILEAEGHAH